MLLITCPWCGNRPELEFSYGGEAHLVRAPEAASTDDAAWADYLFVRRNPKGVHAERWRHAHGCARFFNLLRDTRDDRILTAYHVGEVRPDTESAEADRAA